MEREARTLPPWRAVFARNIREVVPEVIPPQAASLPAPVNGGFELATPPVEPMELVAEPELEDAVAVAVEEEATALLVEDVVAVETPVEDVVLAGAVDDELLETDDEAVEMEAEVDLGPRELVCEISFWRGYRKSRFYARMEEDGEDVAVAESEPFRTLGDGEPEQADEALAAYELLRAELHGAGWEHAGDGSTWYGDTFRRPLMDAAEPAPE